jgi:hypothetical protein
VAVIVAVPGATPVTTPLDVTVATVLSLLDQPTMRPVNTFPLASRGVAVSVTVWPGVVVAVAGVTDTLAMGTCRTVTCAEPCLPSTVATMIAVPGASPVTTPSEDTVARAGAPLDQVTVRPVSG